MAKKLRVGIIGCGEIANMKHMPALAKITEAELAAFCDIVPERAQKAAREYGVAGAKAYADYKEMVEREALDLVHVCTPNRSHCEISVFALEAGLHVMCEKPMAMDSAEAKRMLEAAEKAGKKLTVGYQYRFSPEALYLKKECEKGTLGDIYYAKATALRRRGVPTWGVYLDEYEQGGGPLIDIGTHALDLTLFMMDNYRPKYCVGKAYKKLNDQTENGNMWGDWNPDAFTVEDSAFGFVVMENDATIVVEASWALNILQTGEGMTTLCGTKAGADMQDSLRINGVCNGVPYTLKPEFPVDDGDPYGPVCDDPHDLEARAWMDAILNDTAPYVLPEQAYCVTRILEGIYESSKSGLPYVFE